MISRKHFLRILGGVCVTLGAVSGAQGATFASTTLEIPGVGDAQIDCEVDAADPAKPNNCAIGELPRVQCPANQPIPVSVTVTILGARMSSDLEGSNPAGGQAGCLQVIEVDHQTLNVAVFPDGPAGFPPGPPGTGKLVVDGALTNLGPFSDATCTPTIDNQTPPDTGVIAPPILRYYSVAGGPPVNDEDILVNTKGSATLTRIPTDPDWSDFYDVGGPPQSVPVWLTAQAQGDLQTSGTWQANIQTEAEATVQIRAICRSEDDEEPVPAIGPLGLVLLTGGLVTVGAVFQGHRRRKT